jgi:dephospho-CoA kinase
LSDQSATPQSAIRNPQPAILVGLTGNIACGKSTVLARLATLGAGVIDADAVTREVQRAGAPAYEAIVAAFGPEIVAEDGELDRRALGNRVFADPAALAHLESLVHPAVRAEIARRVAAMPERVIVIDAIKLLESPLAAGCREIWVVTCRSAQQVARLVATRSLTEAEAWLRVRAQPPQAEKVARATVVIDNSGSLDNTMHQINDAWAQLRARYGIAA